MKTFSLLSSRFVIPCFIAFSPGLMGQAEKSDSIPYQDTVLPLAKALAESPMVGDLRNRLDEITGTPKYQNYLGVVYASQGASSEAEKDLQRLNDDQVPANQEANEKKIREVLAELSKVSRGLFGTYNLFLTAGGFTIKESGEFKTTFQRRQKNGFAPMAGLEKETNGYFAVISKGDQFYRFLVGGRDTRLQELGTGIDPRAGGYGEMVMMSANDKGEWKSITLDPKTILPKTISALTAANPELANPIEVRVAIATPAVPGHFRFVKISGPSGLAAHSPAEFFRAYLELKLKGKKVQISDFPATFSDPFAAIRSQNIVE